MIRSMRTRKRIKVFLSYCALAPFMIFTLFPLYWMALTSFKTNQEIESLKGIPFVIHSSPTLKHYIDLFTKTNFLIFFKNTFIVAVLVTIISLTISILAAYALTRMRFFGSETLGLGIFCTYLVPPTLLFIPLFKFVANLGLLNSKWALVLVYPTSIVPFCTWVLIGYFSSVPKELDEAAFVDGASYLQMLFRVFLPVTLPGLIAATMFAFTVSWAGFIYPLAYIYAPEEQVLTVGAVTQLIKGDVYFWGELMAGALLAALPVVVMYSFLMDYYISGLTSGSLKQ
ncbi:MAG: carbohydrate ABC transporter permease [Nitrospinota bacterium]|nr:MAG: carbohydrate ABC transporter permease [Nitrospinota bacterium]